MKTRDTTIIHKLEGTPFIVDVNSREFRQQDRLSNRIPFSKMEYRGSHYLLRYDRDRKTSVHVSSKKGAVITLIIPPLHVLDPAGMAEKYQKDLRDVVSCSDHELIIDPQSLQRRLTGELPTMKIMEDVFLADMATKTLTLQGTSWSTPIDLNKAKGIAGENTFIYHSGARKFVNLSLDQVSKVQKDFLLVELPEKCQIDPVGWYAGFRGQRPQDYLNSDGLRNMLENFLMKYPIEPNPPAKIIPWENSLALQDQYCKNNIVYNEKENKHSPGQLLSTIESDLFKQKDRMNDQVGKDGRRKNRKTV